MKIAPEPADWEVMALKDEDGVTDHAVALGLGHAMEAFHADAEAPAEAPATAATYDEDDESIEAVRSRLAARGLLVKGPAIVVPKEPRPDRPVVLDDVLAEAEGDLHPNAVPEDEWDVSPEGSGMLAVRCPQCRGVQQTPADVTRFRCVDCERAWRWAVCEACDVLAFTMERQESWRCECGHANRSWWRTLAAPREALVVVARRRDVAARAERAAVRAGMRTRRWKILTFAVAGLIAALGFVVVIRVSEPTQAGGTRAACSHFERLRSDLASGTLGLSELRGELDALSAEANGADAEVASAVADLGAAGRPGSAAFLSASTRLADACASAAD